jgi:hypothetical protein
VHFLNSLFLFQFIRSRWKVKNLKISFKKIEESRNPTQPTTTAKKRTKISDSSKRNQLIVNKALYKYWNWG